MAQQTRSELDSGEILIEASAIARTVRMAPRKTRIVAKMVAGRPVDEALTLLKFSRKRAARPVRKVLESAVANMRQVAGADVPLEHLTVLEARVDGGPTLRKWQARARGMAFPIRRRTSHIRVVVGLETKE